MNAIASFVIERRKIIEGTTEIAFDVAGQDFHFKAGQYIKLTIPELLYNDPKGNLRLFSIVSSPNEKGRLEIAFRDSDSAFKRTLKESPLGHKVEIQGPYGLFTLPENQRESIVFVAGGIGIAPCLSMIRFATEENLEHPMVLLYSNNSVESIAYLEELEKLKIANPHFTFCNHIGYVNTECIKEMAIDIYKPIWYVVGPPPMVQATKTFLEELAIDPQKIKFEKFTGVQGVDGK